MNSLWDPVGEQVAMAEAGTPSQIWRTPMVGYALGPAALVVTVEAGDRPDGSGVYAADEVVLRPPFPDDVQATLTGGPDRLPILGFVRVPEGYVPLGRLRVTSHRSSRARGASRSTFEECRLRIEDRLPFTVLDRVRRVLATRLPDLAWLDLLPGDPVGAVRAFVAGWFADVPGAALVPATERTPNVPAPLAAWYEAAAGRQEALGGFNRILTPDQYRVLGDGRIVFGTECQGVWNVHMDPTDPDPVVVYDDLGGGPVVERERLAGYLVQFAVCDAAIGSPYGAFARVDGAAAERLVTAGLRPVPLQPMSWPGDPTVLYAGPGLAVAAAQVEPGAFEIYAGSRHRAALQGLREPGFDWEYFTG